MMWIDFILFMRRGTKGGLNNFIDYNITGGGQIRGIIGLYNISECDIFIVISDEDHDVNISSDQKYFNYFSIRYFGGIICFVRIGRYDTCNEKIKQMNFLVHNMIS